MLTLVYDYQELTVALKCATPIADLLEAALADDQEQARQVLTDHNKRLGVRLGYSREVHRAALRRGIAVTELVQGVEALLLLGSGERQRRVRATVTDRTSQLASDSAWNKAVAHDLMERHGLPVPRQGVVSTVSDARVLAEQIGYPVVVKPAKMGRGLAVTADIRAADDLQEAFEAAIRYGAVVVEKHIDGEDFRLTVFDGVMKSALHLRPAHVVGDGRSTVSQLIQADNRRRAAQRAAGKTSHDIKLTAETGRILGARNLTMDSVPAHGSTVPLRSIANASQGGTIEDVTNKVHPQNRIAAERAARAVGLDVAGVDFITTDITRSHLEIGGGICEINSNPGLDEEGGVLAAYIEHLAPGDTDLSIPLFSVLGSMSAELIDRLGTRLAQTAGPVGLASRRGVTIGDATIAPHGGDNKRGVRILLEDPTTAVAIVEVNAPNVAADGLGFDRCRCVTITDLQAPEGRQSIMDASAKLLLQLCRSFAVLNYDDPSVRKLASYAKSPIWWVSAKTIDEDLRRHVAAGGCATTLEPTGDQSSSVAIHLPAREDVRSILAKAKAQEFKSDPSAAGLFLTSVYLGDLVY